MRTPWIRGPFSLKAMENLVKTQQQAVRVRFAPSPTGHLHIGNLRAALFNWLFARHNNGTFLLRIEDTDYERSREEYVDSIIDSLKWLGLESDESIIRQSERTELYQNYLNQMIESGHAYWSDPATEENNTSVLRFRVPKDRGAISFHDHIRGTISVDADQIDDFVIARADGSPLYNFVVVVDDATMNITHIIRGEDHISNTARQILMYEALGFVIPQFAHLSMILGPTGAPLSKRDAVTSVADYRAMGYLPDALCNYLARLSWSHGDQEVFTRQELIQLFSIDGINKGGAAFDAEKLAWFNGVYIRNASAEELLKYLLNDVDESFEQECAHWTHEQLLALIELYQDRVTTLKELRDVLVRLHTQPVYSTLPHDVTWDGTTVTLLQDLLVRLATLDTYTADAIKTVIQALCKEHDVKLPMVAKPIRFALTGVMESPSVFSIMALLGYDEMAQRIEQFKTFLEGL